MDQEDLFNKYFPYFLEDNPDETCPKGGHAAYADVNLQINQIIN